jgi:hypothetical protein
MSALPRPIFPKKALVSTQLPQPESRESQQSRRLALRFVRVFATTRKYAWRIPVTGCFAYGKAAGREVGTVSGLLEHFAD